MGGEDILNNVKINIEKLGFFFWFILFGFIEIIFSIIYEPKYIPLGLYFFVFGGFGYFIAVLLDKLSSSKYKKEVEENGVKKTIVSPPRGYPFFTFTVKLLVLIGLCFFILKKYPEFNPFK